MKEYKEAKLNRLGLNAKILSRRCFDVSKLATPSEDSLLTEDYVYHEITEIALILEEVSTKISATSLDSLTSSVKKQIIELTGESLEKVGKIQWTTKSEKVSKNISFLIPDIEMLDMDARYVLKEH